MAHASRRRDLEPLSAALAVRLPQALLERVDGASERYGVSRSEIMRDALDSWLQRVALQEMAREHSGTWTAGNPTISLKVGSKAWYS